MYYLNAKQLKDILSVLKFSNINHIFLNGTLLWFNSLHKMSFCYTDSWLKARSILGSFNFFSFFFFPLRIWLYLKFSFTKLNLVAILQILIVVYKQIITDLKVICLQIIADIEAYSKFFPIAIVIPIDGTLWLK